MKVNNFSKNALKSFKVNCNRAAAKAASGRLRTINDEDFGLWLTVFHYVMPRRYFVQPATTR